MEDIFLSVEIGNSIVCMSTLTKKEYLAAGGKGLGGDYGYFIYEYDRDNQQGGIEILAKARSVDSATKLFNMMATPLLAAA